MTPVGCRGCNHRNLLTDIEDFLKHPVELPPEAAGASVGSIWWECSNDWLYPWRVTGERRGYPCGEPKKEARKLTEPKRKWSFNDDGFECHVDLGDIRNELKARP